MIDIALTREEIEMILLALGIMEDETGGRDEELESRLKAALA